MFATAFRPGNRRILAQVVLALTILVGAWVAAPPPTPANAAAPLVTPLSTTDGKFQLTDVNYTAATNNLYNNYLTDHASLSQVVTTSITTDSAGAADGWMNLRSMRTCSGIETKALPPVTNKVAWCWSTAYKDHNSLHWFPQGISSTGEADSGDGGIGGHSVVAVSWHYNTLEGEVSAGCRTHNMIKVTLIDRETKKYRHVLLVEPTSTSSSASDFDFIPGHAGGIVWYDHYIYVTDTHNGIRVFDLRKMAKVDTYGSDVQTYGINGGVSSACGYAYVLPVIHHYSQPTTSCPSTGPAYDDRLCFSWLSLDKSSGSPYKLVAGEFYGGEGSTSRIARYALNPASSPTSPSLLATSGGKTIVHDAYSTSGYRGIQGGVSWTESGQVHFAFNTDCAKAPAIFSHTWVGDTRPPSSCAGGGNWAAGPPEDLSYWPKLGSTMVEELWGLGEGICRSPSDPDYVAPTNPLSACYGYTGSSTGSLRTIYAVGMTDSAVRNRH